MGNNKVSNNFVSMQCEKKIQTLIKANLPQEYMFNVAMWKKNLEIDGYEESKLMVTLLVSHGCLYTVFGPFEKEETDGKTIERKRFFAVTCNAKNCASDCLVVISLFPIFQCFWTDW